MKKKIEEIIKLPEGVSAEIFGSKVTIKGPKGEASKILFDPKIKISVRNSNVSFLCDKGSKYDLAKINTFAAHLRNMIKGIVSGCELRLKICSGHFPINVSVEGKEVVIKNFLGEKITRRAHILEGAAVKVSGDMISVTGCNAEKVGQTAANIEKATYVTNKDRRVFMDGIFIITKKKK